ncbi:MAG: hypothetical protein IJC59_04820 [Lachnospiraceae bacterium]|nr:hypothetical protein [Lachnospiraceae bacterium]
MQALNMMKDAAAGALGNIEKAVIEIIDFRPGAISSESAVSARGGNGGLSSSFASMTDIMDTVNQLRSDKLSVDAAVAGASRKLFYVQFNPNEITLSGMGGGEMAKTDFTNGEKGIGYGRVDVRITMDVKLIFDRVNAKDAFMADKWNTAPTGIATGVAQLGLSLADKTRYSVQQEIEGFIAALRSPYTRRISFCWGDMCYSGILHQVSSAYTMFNVQGHPIRGEVHLSITCADEGISEKSMGKWRFQYERAFQNQNQSYVKAAQKAGNMVNFNL